MYALLLPLLFAGLAACAAPGPPAAPGSPAAADSSGGLALTTDQLAYAPGATATVTLQNGTDAPVSLPQPLACAAVERETGGGWSPVPSDRMCAAVLVPVDAGAAATATVAVPGEVGTYRLSQAVLSGEGGGTVVVSAPFQVR